MRLPLSIDCAHDRGANLRVSLMAGHSRPSAVRTPKSEARAGETHIGGGTARGGEHSFLAEQGGLLLLLVLLAISVLVILLLPLLLWW
jgi:hypothetical protein